MTALAGDSPGNEALAGLVVLAALILSLEILQHLLAARVLAAAAMATAWLSLLSPAAQVRAVLYALATHGASEGVAQWRANFPIASARNRDHLVGLWLLFWARVFIWGATLGALSGFDRHAAESSRGEKLDAEEGSWASVVATATYYEAVEVLLLMYFSAEPLSYRLDQRAVTWVAKLAVSSVERSSAWTQWIMDSSVVSWISPGGIVAVLVVVMGVSWQIPWNELVRHVETPDLQLHKPRSYRLKGDGRTTSKTRIAYLFQYAHEDGSSEDTALDTGSDDELESS